MKPMPKYQKVGKRIAEKLRPQPKLRLSLLETQDSFYQDPNLWAYDYGIYKSLSRVHLAILKSIYHSPFSLDFSSETYKTVFHAQFPKVNPEQFHEVMSPLLNHALVSQQQQGSVRYYTIASRGYHILHMHSRGDIYAEVKEIEFSNFFRQPEIRARIRALAYRFKSYYPNDVTETKIQRFIRQFSVSSDAERMLKILEEVRFFSKLEVTRLLCEYLKIATNDLKDNFSVVLFGNLADSTAEMAQTVLKELFSDIENINVALPIEKALSQPGKIIFLDDNVGSGTQAIQIIEEYLGIRGKPSEHIKVPLSKTNQTLFRKREICIVCCHVSPSGKNAIQEFAVKNNLNIKLFGDQVLIPDVFSNYYVGHLWSTEQHRDFWLKKLKQLGEALLTDFHTDKKKRIRDALGWKDLRGLIVYAHNVPTSSLPFLWKGYAKPDGTWMPLFPRRDLKSSA